MPECPHCNNDVAGDAKFCPHCGKRDPADASYSSYNGPDDIWTAFAFGWVGAIVGAVIGGIIGVQNGAFIKWVVAGAFYGYVGVFGLFFVHLERKRGKSLAQAIGSLAVLVGIFLLLAVVWSRCRN